MDNINENVNDKNQIKKNSNKLKKLFKKSKNE